MTCNFALAILPKISHTHCTVQISAILSHLRCAIPQIAILNNHSQKIPLFNPSTAGSDYTLNLWDIELVQVQWEWFTLLGIRKSIAFSQASDIKVCTCGGLWDQLGKSMRVWKIFKLKCKEALILQSFLKITSETLTGYKKEGPQGCELRFPLRLKGRSAKSSPESALSKSIVTMMYIAMMLDFRGHCPRR